MKTSSTWRRIWVIRCRWPRGTASPGSVTSTCSSASERSSSRVRELLARLGDRLLERGLRAGSARRAPRPRAPSPSRSASVSPLRRPRIRDPRLLELAARSSAPTIAAPCLSQIVRLPAHRRESSTGSRAPTTGSRGSTTRGAGASSRTSTSTSPRRGRRRPATARSSSSASAPAGSRSRSPRRASA